MKLIVGLGNPGLEYEKTRHNVGFIMIDKIAEHYNVNLNKQKFGGTYGEFIYNNKKVIILKPQEFMNLSGVVIQKYLNYFKIDINDILIIYDDMHIDCGKIKLKYKGSPGGHNGLKSIEQNIGTSEYKRIKVGISKNKLIETKKYVLGKFSEDEQKLIDGVKNQIPEIISDYFNLSFIKLMNKYNIK